MSHFFTAVIVPGNTPVESIEATVSRLLAPYDENRAVDPYKTYLPQEEIEAMATTFQISSHNLAELASNLPEWSGDTGGVDEQGLYTMSTSNHQARWDWWVIGGRCVFDTKEQGQRKQKCY